MRYIEHSMSAAQLSGGVIWRALLAGSGLLLSSASWSSPESTVVPVDGETPVAVDSKKLVQWIVERNAEIAEQRYSVRAAEYQLEAEEGLYEPVWSSHLVRESDKRRRSSSEYVDDFTNIKTEQTESAAGVGTGVKFPLPGGGEINVDYELSKERNNLFSEGVDREYTGKLKLRLDQPLLRNRGRQVTEVHKRIASLEQEAANLRYRHVLTSAAQEAAKLYWQLYRADQVVAIRQTALENAYRQLEDFKQRIKRGKASQIEILETEATIADRKAELSRAEQVMAEVLTRIRVSLNASEGSLSTFRLQATQHPDYSVQEVLSVGGRAQYAYQHNPEYRLYQIHHQQEQERYDYALNQTLPRLNFSTGYSLDSLNHHFDQTLDDSLTNSRYRDWFVGVELEVPLEGNRRAKGEVLAQQHLMEQSQHRYRSLHNRIATDIEGKVEQLNKNYEELRDAEQSVALHERLLESERELFEHGRTRLRDVIEREMLLIETRQRLVETAARVEIARIALMVIDGSLLEHYEVTVDGSAATL